MEQLIWNGIQNIYAYLHICIKTQLMNFCADTSLDLTASQFVTHKWKLWMECKQKLIWLETKKKSLAEE